MDLDEKIIEVPSSEKADAKLNYQVTDKVGKTRSDACFADCRGEDAVGGTCPHTK
jgi:hypothetical protein